MLGPSGGNTLTPPDASAVTNSLRQATRRVLPRNTVSPSSRLNSVAVPRFKALKIKLDAVPSLVNLSAIAKRYPGTGAQEFIMGGFNAIWEPTPAANVIN